MAWFVSTTISCSALRHFVLLVWKALCIPNLLSVYGADGARARKSNADGTFTEYVNFGGQPIAEKNQTGAWTDYIYAGGKKIARVDPQDFAIHAHGTNCANCGWQAAGWNLPLTQYTIKPDDKLSFRQYQSGGASGGYALLLTDGTYVNGNIQDTDEQTLCFDTTHNTWHQRTIDLSPFAMRTIQTSWVDVEGTTAPGDWDEWWADIVIYSADGTVTPLFHHQSSVGLTYFGTGGISNVSASVESVGVPSSTSGQSNLTTYYLGDHLGTAQMEFAGGGWPVWQGQFAPFGAELDSQATTNHYKFTGKERDAESGLDYFGARYYASNMGRWMSPDWADKPEAVPYSTLDNPQSLNLYGYVGNNPLGKADKDGHCFEPLTAAVCVVVGAAIVYGGFQAYKAWNKLLDDGKKAQDAQSHAVDCVGKDCSVESVEDFQKAREKLPNDAADAALQTACAVPGTTCSGPVPNGKPGPADAANAVLQTAAGTIDPNKPQPKPKPQPPQPKPGPPKPDHPAPDQPQPDQPPKQQNMDSPK